MPDACALVIAARRYFRLVRFGVSMLVMAPIGASAVTPLSPHLEQSSRLAFMRALAGHADETGGSAILIGLLTVLGTEPAARRYHYRQPYPQLPDVDAEATTAGQGCAKIKLAVRLKASSSQSFDVSGVFCLIDPTHFAWAMKALSVGRRRFEQP